jgi:sugar-specific transcriptional regulator TrmB
MESEKVTNVLESLGFSKNEIIVYLELIREGKASALDISKKTKIHRSNVYDILEKLFEKGIVDEATENEKKIFYPINPEDLLDYLKQKELELENILPEIEKIQNFPEEERKISVSEGMNSVKNILTHLLDFKEPLDMIGYLPEDKPLLEAFLNQFHRLRMKKKISLRAIFSSENMKKIKELSSFDFSQARYLPENNQDVCEIICGNRIVLIVWEAPTEAIIIQSNPISQFYKDKFEILWKKSQFSEQIFAGV